MEPCMETVNFWINIFKEEKRDIDEEIDDVKGTISNERLFQKGSRNEDEEMMHEQNIADNMEYLKWLEQEKDNRLSA